MTTHDVLTAARALISTPDRWTQGHFARSSVGIATSTESSLATCWCPMGAIFHAGGVIADSRPLMEVVDGPVPIWNDRPDRTHAEVLAAFDLAIAATKETP